MRLGERIVSFSGVSTENLTSTHLRRISVSFVFSACLVISAILAPSVTAQEVLPFPPQPSGSIAGRTMQESIYSPAPKVSHVPKNAPNIIIILIDDVGPGLPDTYGGEIHTPALSRIANEGISYNRFHTTAMCSPT